MWIFWWDSDFHLFWWSIKSSFQYPSHRDCLLVSCTHFLKFSFGQWDRRGQVCQVRVLNATLLILFFETEILLLETKPLAVGTRGSLVGSWRCTLLKFVGKARGSRDRMICVRAYVLLDELLVFLSRDNVRADLDSLLDGWEEPPISIMTHDTAFADMSYETINRTESRRLTTLNTAFQRYKLPVRRTDI